MTETSKTWTAEDWMKSMAAAEEAHGETMKLCSAIMQQRPTFSIDEHAQAAVHNSGALEISGPTFRALLAPDAARELARWIGAVFPEEPKPLAVVRDYEPSHYCQGCFERARESGFCLKHEGGNG